MRFHGVFVLLVAVVALNECQAIDPIDRAFLEEWMSVATGFHPSWSIANSSFACENFAGVSCDPNGRIYDINQIPDQWLDLPSGKIKLIGKLPNSIGNLNELVSLRLPAGRLRANISELPVWTMPKLQFMDFAFQRLIGTIPEVITAPLKFIYFRANKITGTIPQAFADLNLTSLHLQETEIECPLPSNFFSKLVSSVIDHCEISLTLLEVDLDTGLICGTIPMNETLPCVVMPTYKQGLDPGAALWSIHSKKMLVEIHTTSAAFYGRNKDGQAERRESYRIDLKGFQVQNDVKNVPTRAYQQETFIGFIACTQRGTSMIWDAQGLFSDGTKLTMTFNLEAIDGVKFSFRIFNWDRSHIDGLSLGDELVWGLQFQHVIKFQHSGERLMTCTKEDIGRQILDGTFSFEDFTSAIIFLCTSDVGSVNSTIVFGAETTTLDVFFNMKGQFIDLSFKWPLTTLKIDGATSLITSGPSPIFISPFGGERALTDAVEFGEIDFNGIGVPNQEWASVHMYRFALFDTDIDYDPDVMISLLFDTSGEPETAPALAVALPVTLAVVVLAAGSAGTLLRDACGMLVVFGGGNDRKGFPLRNLMLCPSSPHAWGINPKRPMSLCKTIKLLRNGSPETDRRFDDAWYLFNR